MPRVDLTQGEGVVGAVLVLIDVRFGSERLISLDLNLL